MWPLMEDEEDALDEDNSWLRIKAMRFAIENSREVASYSIGTDPFPNPHETEALLQMAKAFYEFLSGHDG